jgi:hypothetical protein
MDPCGWIRVGGFEVGMGVESCYSRGWWNFVGSGERVGFEGEGMPVNHDGKSSTEEFQEWYG